MHTQNPRMHHTVPRRYLKRFTEVNTGFLYALDLYDDKIIRQKPEKIMRIRDYYKQDCTHDYTDQYRLEKYFGNELEDNTLNIIDKLINNPEEITDDCTAHIVSYLILQRVRVPRQINKIKTEVEYEANSYLNKENIQVKVNDNIKFVYMMETLLSKDMNYHFTNMIWRIFKSPETTPFVTTDSPVSFYNHLIFPPHEAPIDLSETRVIFPLSSHYLLEMRHEESDKITHMNKNIAVPTGNIDDGHICIEHAYKVRECTADEVMQMNYILTILADRFVVSKSKKVFEDLQTIYFPRP